MENKRVNKKYTVDERLKILDNSRYIRIVKNLKDLTEDDVYIPIKKRGKTVYIVAEKE
jgi:hypothetical protein